MKYFYEKPDSWMNVGNVFICDHPLYNRGTLFKMEEKGLVIVQEHYNEKTKTRWLGTIEPWIASDIFESKRYGELMLKFADDKDEYGLYPTLPLRKAMWFLRMKPLRKEYWEEGFT